MGEGAGTCSNYRGAGTVDPDGSGLRFAQPWIVDREPEMQNARPTTRFYPDESDPRAPGLRSASFSLPTAYCLEVAVYTGGHPLEKGPKSLTLSHFWARPGVIPTCRDSICKSFHVK